MKVTIKELFDYQAHKIPSECDVVGCEGLPAFAVCIAQNTGFTLVIGLCGSHFREAQLVRTWAMDAIKTRSLKSWPYESDNQRSRQPDKI